MNVPNKLKFLATVIPLLLFTNTIFAQEQTPNYSIIDNLSPVTPTMSQFTKYTDLPVSEYTGIPNISIPLYEIDEDGVKIPLELTYNSAGIRVSEEASWVGLGWDMTFGSIVEQISDQDDYAATTHLQPDFYNTGEPYLFPFKYAWADPDGTGDNTCNYGCSGPIEIPALNINDGILIYTSEYAPFGGDYGYQKPMNYESFFSDHFTFSIDSEPDIFTADFLGHSFKFMRDPNTGQVVVLNKKGYQVTRNSQGWKVLAPDGTEYDFAMEDVVKSQTETTSITGAQNTSYILPSSNIWLLTQIITKNQKVIAFNYTQTAVQQCYPSVTQRGVADSIISYIYTSNTAVWGSFCASSDVTTRAPEAVSSNIVFPSEQYTYLSSITFQNGTVNFNLSARNDILGGLKLDSLQVSTSQQPVKSYHFNYSYFDATAVGGNTFNFGTFWGNCPLYRLQLLSIQDNSGATHTFTYNSTLLPPKNSFAVDYWGYYNGDVDNSTFIPNAAQFNQTGWLVNSDNHSANLTYTQAGILQQIKYPTGGTVNFTYALNQFNNYWVPDYSSSTNTVSSGNGLRIQAITWNDLNNSQLQKTTYSYSTGLAALPLNFFRSYNYSTTPPGNPTVGQAAYIQHIYGINETNMSGIYTANPFASFNGVGYSQVVKTDVDNNNNPNGKTVSNYFNAPDLVYNSITQAAQSDPTLPAYKDPNDTAENGSLKSELYYDNNNNLLKKVSNTYYKINSPLYYGARLMGYASLARYIGPLYEQDLLPQSMVGYYPIYDFETLLAGSTETDYFGTDSITATTTNTYDSYNQLASTTKTNSTYSETSAFSYPYAYPNVPVLAAMTAANRLSDIVTVTNSQPQGAVNLHRGYRQLGNLYVANADTNYTQLAYAPEYTTYDQYDPSNGNIWQYTKNTVPNSFLWDYNKEYVIAAMKNALLTNIAYTSFEADGTGRWKFSGLPAPDPAAPTGHMVYPLGNGSIYRDSLDATQTYIVSYWSKSGAQTVSGSTATKQGYTFNGYTYYESTVPTPAAGTITVSGTGTIDELRLYPNTAQMTSYTYSPLVGITSESSEGGKIAYYEYDNAMRLLDIRDQNKNILKAFCYNYAGQPTTCGVNVVYTNAALSVPFTIACPAGDTSTMVYYSVAAGEYSSTMSQADADSQAQADVTANGQAYANTHCTCVAKINFALKNTSSDGYQVNFSNSSFNVTFTFTSPGTNTIAVPQGTYTVDVYPTGAYNNHTFTLGSRTPVTDVPRTYFYSVNVATGSSDSSLTIQ